MTPPVCPRCGEADMQELFTRSEPIEWPGRPTVQWVAYRCKRCNVGMARLERVADD